MDTGTVVANLRQVVAQEHRTYATCAYLDRRREHDMSRPKAFRAFLLLAMAVPFLTTQTVAHADVIGSQQYLSAMDRRAILDSVTETLAREDLRLALKHYGVDPAMAAERIAALNDEELMLLHDVELPRPARGAAGRRQPDRGSGHRGDRGPDPGARGCHRYLQEVLAARRFLPPAR